MARKVIDLRDVPEEEGAGADRGGLRDVLQAARLSHLTDRFVEAAIDVDVLPYLSEADLRELGLPLGDRKRALAAFARLREGATGPAPAADQPAMPAHFEAERRQVTVLFCDLVGSTSWANRLDPEDMAELLRLYQETVRSAVARYGGAVMGFSGDGALVVFGYPMAHEDAPERAVRAGLEIAASMPKVRMPWTDERLQARVGVATGVCVVGETGDAAGQAASGVVGDIVPLAARMQSVAEPGSVLVCPVTQAVVGLRLQARRIRPITLKGFAEPVPCFRALGVAAARPAVASVTARAAGAPLFGGQSNLDRLLALWSEAVAGGGRIARIVGEPGSGKSHLVATLLALTGGEDRALIEWHCSQFARNTAFDPILGHLRDAAGAPDGAPQGPPQHGALAAPDAQARTHGTDRQRALLAALSQPSPDVAGSPEPMGPSERRQAILDLIVADIEETAAARPTLLFVEDAHWADPSTRDALAAVAGRMGAWRLLVVVTTRGEHRAGDARAQALHAVELRIGSLDAESARALIRHVAGDVSLPDQLVNRIVEKSDGIPLYLGEVTRAVLAARDGPVAEEVPATLKAALSARLGALGSNRRVAQIAAVFGREFEPDLLAGAMDEPLAALLGRLDALSAQQIVRPVAGAAGTASYRFTHALIQDAAYESLLRRDRIRLHGEVAGLLEAHRPAVAEAQPERIARHREGAEDHARAAAAWLRATEQAMRNSAHQEALAHCHRGLSAIERAGPGRERTLLEIKLSSAQGRTLISTEGHSSEAVRATFARAERLCAEATAAPDLFPVMWGVNAHHMVRGEVAANMRASARLVEIAESTRDREQQVVAHTSRGLALYYAGAFEESLEQIRTMQRLYDCAADPMLAYKYAVDRMVVGLQHGSWVLWMLGRADEAAAMERALHAHVQEFPHPYSYAQALTSGASVYVLRREPALMLERARAGVAYARERGREVWVDHGDLWIGWALSETGDHRAGLEHASRALDRYASGGSRSSLPKFHCIVAEILLRLGRAAEALTLMEAALEHIERLGEQCYRAECLRIRADARRHTGARRDAVEADLRAAMAIADAQKALGWRLRAARDLARLLLDAGERRAAAEMLGAECAGIMQGHDTADVREALALLAAAR